MRIRSLSSLLILAFALAPAWVGAQPAADPNPTGETSTKDVGPGDPPLKRDDPASIPLWEKGAPGFEAIKDQPERWMYRREPGLMFPVLTHVSNPSITTFLPDPARATGAAVIVAPGGGHMFHSIDHEGYDVARWLQSIGVAGIVLKYRLAREPDVQTPYTPEEHAAADGLRAVRMVRAHAKEWNINPDKIGMIGFSAGAQVTFYAATKWDKGNPDAADPIEKVSSRPDFAVYGYGGGGGGGGGRGGRRGGATAAAAGASTATATAAAPAATPPAGVNLGENPPPAFMFCAFNDNGPFNIAIRMAQAYKLADVPAEVHIYNSGGHGYGIRPGPLSVATWPQRLQAWMTEREIIPPVK